MNANLIIPVGIPGCGKSTYAHTFFNKATDKIWSTDAIRALPRFCGDATDQSQNDEVFTFFHATVYEDLLDGFRVFADATNLTCRARETLREIATGVGVPMHLVVFEDCAGAVCRNLNRDRVVPPNVMLRMLENYEQFRLDLNAEAALYDTITYVREFA